MDNSKPWEEAQLASSAHATLYARRQNATPEEQNKIAPYEHRAFAREAVADNPLMAVPLAVAIPAYQASKALGLEKSRSEASTEQVTQAYTGVGEGLSKAVKKPWEEAREMMSNAMMATETAVKKLMPWEKAQQAAPAAARPSSLEQGWDVINQRVRNQQRGRDAKRLEILQQELADEKNPKTAEIIKREIARTEKLLKGKG